MIDFDELFGLFVQHDDQTRFDLHGGYPSQWERHCGKYFVATINDQDEPRLEIHDADKFREFVVILVQMFCEEKGLSSYEEIENHDDYGDFIESLIHGVWELQTI